MKYWAGGVPIRIRSHDLWFLTEDIRWGKFEPGLDTKTLINKVNREDCGAMQQRPCPLRPQTFPHRRRGGRRHSSMARSSILKIQRAYLRSLGIKRAQV